MLRETKSLLAAAVLIGAPISAQNDCSFNEVFEPSVSQFFTSQCTTYTQDFQACLLDGFSTSTTYTSVTVAGSGLASSISCSDPAIAHEICESAGAGEQLTRICGGYRWEVYNDGLCNGGGGLAVAPDTGDAFDTNCVCRFENYVYPPIDNLWSLHPCSGSLGASLWFYGGVNATCGADDQSLSITCVAGGSTAPPPPTPPPAVGPVTPTSPSPPSPPTTPVITYPPDSTEEYTTGCEFSQTLNNDNADDICANEWQQWKTCVQLEDAHGTGEPGYHFPSFAVGSSYMGELTGRDRFTCTDPAKATEICTYLGELVPGESSASKEVFCDGVYFQLNRACDGLNYFSVQASYGESQDPFLTCQCDTSQTFLLPYSLRVAPCNPNTGGFYESPWGGFNVSCPFEQPEQELYVRCSTPAESAQADDGGANGTAYIAGGVVGAAALAAGGAAVYSRSKKKIGAKSTSHMGYSSSKNEVELEVERGMRAHDKQRVAGNGKLHPVDI